MTLSEPHSVPHSVAGKAPESLSVIIPLLNEADGLDALSARLAEVLDTTGCDWDVLFVDDGSTDGTLRGLKVLSTKDPRFSAISLSRNFGKERAIAAGLHYVQGDAAIIMDGDLQHPPKIILDFLARWREGFDIVYGQRMARDTEGPIRRGMAHGFYAFFRVLSQTPIPKDSGDFRLLNRKAIDAMNQLGERERFNKGLFSWIGFRTTAVPYQVAERSKGRAKWRTDKLMKLASDGITSFSNVPLRVSSVLGFLISISALTYALYFLVWTLAFGADLPGFPSLIISIMLLSGVQLLSLGVIGEYLGRVYEEVKGRPLYLVAEEVGRIKPPRLIGQRFAGRQDAGHDLPRDPG